MDTIFAKPQSERELIELIKMAITLPEDDPKRQSLLSTLAVWYPSDLLKKYTNIASNEMITEQYTGY
jgi:hypothetical protein